MFPLAVKAVVVFKEFKWASLPDMMTFFQLGILTILLWLVTGLPAHFPYGPIILYQ